MNYPSLNADKALIWRIVHRDNLPRILDNGLHCANSNVLAPLYVNIGNTDLIDKRRTRRVPIAPEGFLADYVPFYFTPFSVMMKNTQSGWGVQQRTNDEILILVSSLYHLYHLYHLEQLGLPFSQMAWITEGLHDLRRFLIENPVKSVAVPPLG